jgi:3-methyladenine DNA glycosylase AlkD
MAEASSGIIQDIQAELEMLADENNRRGAQYYFKEAIVLHGVKTVLVNKMARQYLRTIKQLDKEEVFALAEKLLQTDNLEEATIAFDWVYGFRAHYLPGDFDRFAGWVSRYVNNWAKCDTFCNHAVGAFIDKYPEYLAGLKQWAKSPDRWLRRAACVSLIMPARRGRFLDDVLEIADLLLDEKDDLVKKGCGWMLREAGKLHENEVFLYIMRNKADMPRTTLRYAIEKMPEDRRRKAMAK